MNIDTPFVDDPARDSADAREALLEKFRCAMRECGAEVVEISGSWSERKRAAIAAIESYAAR